ncbi:MULTISPECIES: arginyltransferase [Methylocaldum]|jgi:arginyl-tRNA--protein-N-Asp/Glu arginylyltransferase|uniref:arginyltransferase n=1 Tax=unclassified Methylocaldum TaxID=2622260 RepID=UPI000A320009|nr:arginyltransferase [Methylocaldum sp. RMAD-M]MBP1152090.1 arginine-tRNA-protein transferase [Methylocaldum sp. RMAD-M]MDV3241081.1 arginyltransferase [Methylocaldum sp.]MVF20586.1 arginyltransferase [Methylocaldum sp. BRCS4]
MKSIPLYISYEHDCDYLPGRQAQMAYVSPREALDVDIYSWLATRGFRRSGDMVYRPHCSNCSACVPVRIPVARFRPNRGQRRIQRMNADLEIALKPARFEEAHYRLFLRYLNARHSDGHMAESSAEDYIRFLACGWAETGFYEFKRGDSLLAVAVTDCLADGLSAVYTFFDPDLPALSLGSYAILWQVAETKRRGLDWLYLGFWISGCRKMSYKNSFRPLQALVGEDWVLVEKGENIVLET